MWIIFWILLNIFVKTINYWKSGKFLFLNVKYTVYFILYLILYNFFYFFVNTKYTFSSLSYASNFRENVDSFFNFFLKFCVEIATMAILSNNSYLVSLEWAHLYSNPSYSSTSVSKWKCCYEGTCQHSTEWYQSKKWLMSTRSRQMRRVYRYWNNKN
jgi:hypothetical protein